MYDIRSGAAVAPSVDRGSREACRAAVATKLRMPSPGHRCGVRASTPAVLRMRYHSPPWLRAAQSGEADSGLAVPSCSTLHRRQIV